MSNNSNEEQLVISNDPLHPANLIPELCRLFYTLGWVTGTGGGISIKKDDHVYVSPSGVQKERMEAAHLYVLNLHDRAVLRKPLQLKPSSCTPLFYNCYDRRGAGACIHTHSQNAVMVTLLYDKTFEIRNQEMIKGIRIGSTPKYLQNTDTLVVPIIDNKPFEEDLTDIMAKTMEEYPETNAILVRRHGVFVWGDSWEKAKTMTECYDYLFEMAVKMKSIGLDPAA